MPTPPHYDARSLNRQVRLAARLFGAPIALLRLSEPGEAGRLVAFGLEDEAWAHETPPFEQASPTEGVLIVEDACANPRFAGNALVTGAPGIRFFAGRQLTSPNGPSPGVLVVFDTQPRTVDPEVRDLFEELANLIAAGLERGTGRNEDALLKQRLRLKARLLASIGQAVVVTDLDGAITYWNRAAEHFYGWKAEEVLGRPMAEIAPADETPARTAEIVAHLRSGAPRHGEILVQRRDGTRIPALVTDAPVFDEYGQLGGVIRISADLTEREEVQRKLVEAKEHAETMMRLKTAVLTNMSHEIRTPLSAIIGFTEVLQEHETGEAREYAALISGAAERLMVTLNSVLDLAQLESQSLALKPSRLDLTETTRETCHLFQNQATTKGLSLTLDVPDEPVVAFLDYGATVRILNNLLSNAIKFTNQGEIVVRVANCGTEVLLEVVDTGIGMHASFMPRLFEDFEQESNGLSRRYGGNGLGLPITKRLVELMGGRIEVESKQGVGTVFRVFLPQSIEAPELPEPVRSDTGNALEATSALVHASPKRYVLAVDDDEAVGVLIAHFLGHQYEVGVATNAAEALAQAQARRYDAVLLDIDLRNGQSGEDVLRDLRALPDYTGVPVVAVTAHALPMHQAHYLRAGFDAYLCKPFTRRHLMDELHRLLDRPQP